MASKPPKGWQSTPLPMTSTPGVNPQPTPLKIVGPTPTPTGGPGNTSAQTDSTVVGVTSFKTPSFTSKGPTT